MKMKMLAFAALLALPLCLQANELTPVTVTAKAAAKAAPAKKAKLKTKAKAPKKLASAKHEHWVCPMHDGGESDHAGKCPKCGMDLVKEEI